MSVWRERPFFSSISSRLTLLVLTTGVITFAVLAIWTISLQTKEAEKQANQELSTLSLKSRSTLERIFRYQLNELIEEVIQELEVHRLVKRAFIYSPNQRIQFSTNTAEVGRWLGEIAPIAVEQGNPLSIAVTSIRYVGEQNEFYSFVPLVTGVEQDQRLQQRWLLIIYHHDSSISQSLFNKRTMLASQLAIVILLSGALWYYLRQRLGIPLKLLRDNIEQLRDSSLVLQVPIHSADELGQIARSLESVSRQRAESIEQLNNLSTAIEQSNDCIVITNVDGAIEYVNQAYCNVSGYSKEELLGQNPRKLQSGKVLKETYQHLWQRLNNGHTWRGELTNKRKDGSTYVLWSTITPIVNANGDITHYIGVQDDITEHKANQERLRFLAYHDRLTGLPNRVHLLEIIEKRLLDHHGHCQDPLYLVGIDELKRVNDARGFAVGSAIIKQFASRLTAFLREHPHQLAHLGGDVFAILLTSSSSSGSHLDTPLAFAHALLLTCEDPFEINGEPIQVSASAGCVLLSDSPACETHTQVAEQVIRLAETAMHEAKMKGGNHAEIYHAELSTLIENSFEIEKHLRSAIQHDGLTLYIQSQFDRQRRVVSAEALVRWQHQTLGWLSPADFIPVAEKSDLIILLDRWVITHVCILIRRLIMEKKAVPISINISGRHFRKPYFVEWIRTTIDEHSIPPSLITLEVTEGVFLDDLEAVAEKMKALRAKGIGFSLDDFGTGYSSLTYLRRLPVDEIKIDRSFVMAIGQQTADNGIIEAIMAVAQHLQLKVVAEGVETKAQADFLFAHNPNTVVQGFGYAKPTDAASWLNTL